MSKTKIKEKLVILSSWTRDGRSYKKLMDTAPSHWEVFVPSYTYLKPYKGMDFFAARLKRFLEENNLDKFNLLGHSLGGALAVHFVSEYELKLKKLFLVDSKGACKPKSLVVGIRTLFKSHTKRSVSDNINAFLRVMENPFLNLRLGLIAHYLEGGSRAKKLRVDTSILWGENDVLTPLSHGKRLKKLIKKSKLTVLKGMGHDWILNNPEHFWNNI